MRLTEHKDKEYGVYHWDTTSNTTMLIAQEDTLYEAQEFIAARYGDRLDSRGVNRAQVATRAGDVVYSTSIS